MQKHIKISLTIEETEPYFNQKTPLLKIQVPLDSKNREVCRKSNRVIRNIVYFFIERGYSTPDRIIYDCLRYDPDFSWDDQPINRAEKK